MKTNKIKKKIVLLFIILLTSAICYSQYFPTGGYQDGMYGKGGDQTLSTLVKVRVFLQCPYAGNGLMNTNLQSIIPNDQPYNRIPWNHIGNETLNSIPVNMVDWILVELRDAADSSLIVAQRAAILLNDGNIADTNLAPSVNFDGVPPGNYYLCLHHRNHLPVMSANPIAIPNASVYDFSDTLNFPPYGGGSQALIELEPGVYGMIGGDVNSDGTLKYSGPNNDRGLVLQLIVNQTGSTNITATTNGYYDEDINMNGTVKYSGPDNDPSIIIQNLVNLTGLTSITTIFVTPVPPGVKTNPCGSLIDQRDGHEYSTVQIGSQCWMDENLAYLPSVNPSNVGSTTTPHFYVYGYQGTNVAAAKATSNYQIYGVLYNWPAVMDGASSSNSVPSGVQGICPAGWHLPSDEEWKILEGEVDSFYGYPDPEWNDLQYRGTDAGGNLKETGTTHWIAPNTGATNSSLFTALPGGYRRHNGIFAYLEYNAYFWSSTLYGSYGCYRNLRGDHANIGRLNFYKSYGYSVRCIKD